MAELLGGYSHTGQGRQSRKSIGIALKSRWILSGLEGAAVVTLGANQAAARKWRCSDWLFVFVVFFSWEQENEERQPSKGHFSGDQEMILQIYGLQGKKSWQLYCVLSCCQELLVQKLLAQNPDCCDFYIPFCADSQHYRCWDVASQATWLNCI